MALTGRLVLLALLALTGVARADALIELSLSRPPHAPDGAPDVIAHLPSRLDRAQPLHVVVFLHGFNSCARALVASEPVPCAAHGEPHIAYGLARSHEQAAGNSLLLVPQLAFLQRDGRAPRFEPSGGFDAFLADVRAQLASRLPPTQPIANVTLIAHSAGYRATATILRDPALAAPVRDVVLCDALYALWDAFADFLLGHPERRVISLYTHDRATQRGNQNLAALVRKQRKSDASAAIGVLEQEQVDTPHGLIPTRHFGALLERLNAPPGTVVATRGSAREQQAEAHKVERAEQAEASKAARQQKAEARKAERQQKAEAHRAERAEKRDARKAERAQRRETRRVARAEKRAARTAEREQRSAAREPEARAQKLP